MKNIIYLILIITAGAKADTASFMQYGLAEMTQSIQDTFKTELASSSDCPDSGRQILEKLSEKKSSLLSAATVVQSVIDETEQKALELRAQKDRCGLCAQKNVVSSFSAVNPEKIKTDSFCENRPTETLVGEFNSTAEIQKYTQDTLKGKNEDGIRLAKNCPDPCAYYLNTAQTPLENGKQLLTLTIQCGQPRKDSIISAVYSFKSGIVQHWSCIK